MTSKLCEHCTQFYKGRCDCCDYKRCRDCPMPRKVLLADRYGDQEE